MNRHDIQNYSADQGWWQTRVIKGKMILLLLIMYVGIPQFMPEYYRDAQDILLAEESDQEEQGNPRRRLSLFARIRNLFQRPAPTPDTAESARERARPAH